MFEACGCWPEGYIEDMITDTAPLTLQAAADMLHVHPDTLKNWEAAGQLLFQVERPGGRHRRYPVAGLKAQAEYLRVHGGPPPRADEASAAMDIEDDPEIIAQRQLNEVAEMISRQRELMGIKPHDSHSEVEREHVRGTLLAMMAAQSVDDVAYFADGGACLAVGERPEGHTGRSVRVGDLIECDAMRALVGTFTDGHEIRKILWGLWRAQTVTIFIRRRGWATGEVETGSEDTPDRSWRKRLFGRPAAAAVQAPVDAKPVVGNVCSKFPPLVRALGGRVRGRCDVEMNRREDGLFVVTEMRV